MTTTSLLALAVAVAALVVALVALQLARGSRRVTEPPAPALATDPADDVDWQLQWIEPGVYFLANTSPSSVAYAVEVSSVLTPATGGSAALTSAREVRVNPGAWVEVRHPGVGPSVFDDLQELRRSAALTDELRRRPAPLSDAERETLSAADTAVYELQDRVEFTLAYHVSWRTSTGAARERSPLEQRLVPSPVLV